MNNGSFVISHEKLDPPEQAYVPINGVIRDDALSSSLVLRTDVLLAVNDKALSDSFGLRIAIEAI